MGSMAALGGDCAAPSSNMPCLSVLQFWQHMLTWQPAALAPHSHNFS